LVCGTESCSWSARLEVSAGPAAGLPGRVPGRYGLWPIAITLRGWGGPAEDQAGPAL
jgi:hypothetical protein